MKDDDPFHVYAQLKRDFDDMTAFLGLIALGILAFLVLHLA